MKNNITSIAFGFLTHFFEITSQRCTQFIQATLNTDVAGVARCNQRVPCHPEPSAIRHPPSARTCRHSMRSHLLHAYGKGTTAGGTWSSLISQIIKYAEIRMQDTRSTRLVCRSPTPTPRPPSNAMQLSGACSRHFSNSPNYGEPVGASGSQWQPAQLSRLSSCSTRIGLGFCVGLDCVGPASVGWVLDGLSLV